MKLLDFLSYISLEKKIPTTAVVGIFTDTEYPLLITQLCIGYLQKQILCKIESFDVSHVPFESAQAQLTTSFLGQKKIYALCGFSLIDAKTKQQWIELLRAYSGPHTLVVFGMSKEDVPVQATDVELPGVLSLRDAISFIATFSGVETKKVEFFLSQCAKGMREIALESLCLMIYYIKVVGSASEFFVHWAPKIFPVRASLFLLSQYLFAKQPEKFFALYKEVESVYEQPFWTSFWSEQLWNASGYINFMRQNNPKDAKLIGTRLPFSFLNTDWKRYTQEELSCAHDMMYQLDVAGKLSRHPVGLDIFYAQFLYSDFRS